MRIKIVFQAVAGMALAAAVVAARGASGAGALQDENLLAPIPQGFVIGSQGQNGAMLGAEYIPAGETVQDWSRMVTVQVFRNLPGADPDGFAGGLATRWQAACKGSSVVKTTSGVENGYRFSIWLYECPLNPQTGKPENMFDKLIGGQDALYSIQYAYRSDLTKEKITPAMLYLKSVRVCDTRRPDRPCPPVRP